MFEEYMEFVQKFNVLGLAIGLMIGSNLKDVAGDFIDDILMPFVNPILKQISNGKEGEEEGSLSLSIPGTEIKLKLPKAKQDKTRTSLGYYEGMSLNIKKD